MIGEKLNAFDVNVDKSHLFNIATGKSAKEESTPFFYQSIRPVMRWDKSLQKNVGKSQSISRNKPIIANFTHFKLNVKEKRYQTRMPKLLHHVGRVLRLSLKNSIEMAEVLQHPLTPVPLLLSHVDWTLLRSPKSALMKHLDSKVKSSPSTSINVTSIDAMFFMYF